MFETAKFITSGENSKPLFGNKCDDQRKTKMSNDNKDRDTKQNTQIPSPCNVCFDGIGCISVPSSGREGVEEVIEFFSRRDAIISAIEKCVIAYQKELPNKNRYWHSFIFHLMVECKHTSNHKTNINQVNEK